MCNRAPVQDLVPWKPKIGCMDGPLNSTELSELEAEVLRRPDCFIEFFPPDTRVLSTFCDPSSVISTCNMTGLLEHHDDFLVHACSVYPLPVTYFGKKYANVFCALCNGETLSTPTTECDYNLVQDVLDLLMFVPLPSPSGQAGWDPCPTDQLWDPMTGQCRVIHCIPPHMLNIRSKQCVSMMDYALSLSLQHTVRVMFDRPIPISEAVQVVLNVTNNKLKNIEVIESVCQIELYPITSQTSRSSWSFSPLSNVTDVTLLITTQLKPFIDGSEAYSRISEALTVTETVDIVLFETMVVVKTLIHGVDPLMQLPNTSTQYLQPNRREDDQIDWNLYKVFDNVRFYEDPYNQRIIVDKVVRVPAECRTFRVITYGLHFLPCLTYKYNTEEIRVRRVPDGIEFTDFQTLVRFGEFISTSDIDLLVCVNTIRRAHGGAAIKGPMGCKIMIMLMFLSQKHDR